MMNSVEEERRPLMGQLDSSKMYTSRRSMSVPSGKMFGSSRNLEVSYAEASLRHQTVRPSLVGSGTYSVSLSWSDICVSVKIPGQRSWSGPSRPPSEKLILKNIDGVVAPGSLVAIMGASGSGKSTLLNVLTSRNTKDYEMSGEIRLNGVKVGSNIKNVSAYVQQNDLFIHTLTVREQLQFRALLRMDRRFDKRERLLKVEEVIAEIGLTGCADSRIGAASGTKKGISGGERKRLAFACEALANPPIFFCDEPSSSLDSFMAQNIVKTMQRMARRGRTILCTIHQPSSEVFAMFSQLLLLSEGRVAFMGEANQALDFFESMNAPCPHNFNPGDHYILTLAIVPGKERECRQRANAICDAFKDSEAGRQLEIEDDVLKSREDDGDNHMDIMMVTNVSESKYDTPMTTQLSQLLWRAWTSQFRDAMLCWTRIIQAVVLGVIIGLVYLQIDIDQRGVQDLNGALFLLISNVAITNMFPVLSSFPEEMGIIMREYGSGMYGLTAYFLTKTVAEFPLFGLATAIYCAIVYWLIGLEESVEAFFILTVVLVINAGIAVAIGYTISIVTGNSAVALSVTSPILLTFMLFGGLLLNDDSVPDYFIWLQYSSWFRYSYEILMTNEWKHVDKIDCEGIVVNGTWFGIGCPFRDGKDVLRYQDMDEDSRDENFIAISSICIILYIVALISLRIRGRRSME